jgi:putative RecB family exonuclease
MSTSDSGASPTPPQRLSPSGASTFTQCPRRWRMRYIEKLPDPPGEAALVGTFAHRVLEVLMDLDPTERTVDTARAIAADQWPQMADDNDFLALGFNEAEARSFRWKSWNAIEGLWAIEDPRNVNVEATEQRVQTELGSVPFSGVVDRLEREADGLVVSDYKSGKAPSPRYRESRLDQVLLYAAAVHASTGEMPVRARLLYLGDRHVATDVTNAALDSAVGRLGDTWSAIQTACSTDSFAPTTGPLCGWCPYLDRCTEGQEAVAARTAAGR